MEKAIPIKHKDTHGAISKVVFFRPILSTSIAAMIAPGGAPKSGATAHQEPSSFVVGMVELGESSFGRNGDVHPKLIPELNMENAPKSLLI